MWVGEGLGIWEGIVGLLQSLPAFGLFEGEAILLILFPLSVSVGVHFVIFASGLLFSKRFCIIALDC